MSFLDPTSQTYRNYVGVEDRLPVSSPSSIRLQPEDLDKILMMMQGETNHSWQLHKARQNPERAFVFPCAEESDDGLGLSTSECAGDSPKTTASRIAPNVVQVQQDLASA